MNVKHEDHINLTNISISKYQLWINKEHCPKHCHYNKHNWIHALVCIMSKGMMSRDINKPSSSTNEFNIFNNLWNEEGVHAQIADICQIFDLVPEFFD